MAVSDNTSSPTPASFKTPQDELSYYKAQYEHLAGELQEFQTSSKELEAELEKDIEASEKRERSLKEKVEGLHYEVDEWKTKYKQSKADANQAQNALQKEITSLRDTNRTLQLQLRDIEVANDDYERQARNTTSSLEDLESKYNISLERGVMMEEEIKLGEQEREHLRIEAQRLRDELSDLKVESEITQEKLRSHENKTRNQANRSSQTSQASDPRMQLPKSPSSERSGTSFSTPELSTPPPTKSEASGTTSDALTPPSPPLSESSAPTKPADATPVQAKDGVTTNGTPRLGYQTMPHPRHTRGPGLLSTNGNTTTPSFTRRTAAGTTPRPRGAPTDSLPRSGSLYQIRGLIGKMQKLEERVQSARSKLPAPTNTPPRASPGPTANAEADLLSNVTVRSNKKRLTTNGTESSDVSTPTRPAEEGGRRITHRHSRLSMGGSSVDLSNSRPGSRASIASYSASALARPGSRTSFVGRSGTTGDAQPPQNSIGELRRPRSSLSGRGTPSHGYRQSISGSISVSEDAETPTQAFATPTARRTTLDKNGFGSAIPTPSSALRRQSGKMGPPERVPSQQRQQQQQQQQPQHGIGDTY